jgi:hypothetical protein
VTPKAIALAGSQVIAGNQVNSRAHALRARRRGRVCRAHTARVRLACRRARPCCCCCHPRHPPLPSHTASSAMLRVAASEKGEEISEACALVAMQSLVSCACMCLFSHALAHIQSNHTSLRVRWLLGAASLGSPLISRVACRGGIQCQCAGARADRQTAAPSLVFPRPRLPAFLFLSACLAPLAAS